jgi:hypothetical protein
MNRTGIIRGSARAAMLVIFLAMSSWTQATEHPHLDNISRALGASAYTSRERSDLYARAVAAITAGMPADDAEIVITRGLDRKADADTIIRFLAICVTAMQEGLPVAPVLDRIEQGLSKGVPAERITAASERLVETLRTARPLVDKLIHEGLQPVRNPERDEATASAARALERSIPADALREMGAAIRAQGGSLQLFSRTADTEAYFAARGMPARTAAHLVRKAIDRGYTGRQLDAMVRRLDTELKKGTRVEDAAAMMDRDVTGRESGRGDLRQEMRTDHGRSAGSGMGGRGR